MSQNSLIKAKLSNNTLLIYIDSIIGNDTGNIDVSSVRALVDKYINQNITEANVYVNSKGGDVFAATEIDSQLERFSSVTFYLGSLAASAATYITSNPKFKVVAKYNTKIMIHMPSVVAIGNIDAIKSKIKLLSNVTNDYRKRYALKSKMTEDQIQTLWEKGDYWMDAIEAQEKGFVDDIIDNEAIKTSMSENDIVTAMIDSTKKSNSIEYYLENDIEQLEVIAKNDPVLFEKMNDEYFNMDVGATNEEQTIANTSIRSNWTVDDYLDKAPELLKVMAKNNPVQFEKLNSQYFDGI